MVPHIFFVNRIDFWLPDILQDRSHDPCGRERDSEALLIRINVRSHTFIQPAEILIHACRHPS